MPETAQTLERGVRLLRVIGAARHGATMTELARELGLGRAIVYRLVATLQGQGLVRRGADGRVWLGFGLLELAREVDPQLRVAALPALRALAERVGATAHLAIADGDEAVAVAVVEPSWTDFHVAYRVGARHRLDQGAAGRAILLGRSGAAGAVRSEGELQAGAYGVAAPIRGVPGLEASIGVVALRELPPEIDAAVASAADDLATALQ